MHNDPSKLIVRFLGGATYDIDLHYNSFGIRNFQAVLWGCVPNCINCSPSGVCVQCVTGYFLHNTVDNLCYNPCPNRFFMSGLYCVGKFFYL